MGTIKVTDEKDFCVILKPSEMRKTKTKSNLTERKKTMKTM